MGELHRLDAHTNTQTYSHSVYCMWVLSWHSVLHTRALCPWALQWDMCAVSRSIRLAKEMQKRGEEEEEEEGKDGLEKRQRGLELKNNRQIKRHTDHMPPTHPLQHATIATAEWANDGSLCINVSVYQEYISFSTSTPDYIQNIQTTHPGGILASCS